MGFFKKEETPEQRLSRELGSAQTVEEIFKITEGYPHLKDINITTTIILTLLQEVKELKERVKNLGG